MSVLDFSILIDSKFGRESIISNLIIKLVNDKNRYLGDFRITSSDSKIQQNLSQSMEIKVGDFLEEIVTEYIEYFNYNNLSKKINITMTDQSRIEYSFDQLFEMNSETICLIEQKIRDDHDSSKKRGQIDNFIKKIEVLKYLYPNKTIISIMWFIDPNFKKNKKYYETEISKIYNAKIFYGEELFSSFFGRKDEWNRILELFSELRNLQNSYRVIDTVYLSSSDEVFEVLKFLYHNNKRLIKKLMSNNEDMKRIREEYFLNGYNIERLKEYIWNCEQI